MFCLIFPVLSCSRKKICCVIISGCFFFIIMPFCTSAWGSEEKAEFSIYLFQNGMPIADAEVAIQSEVYETTHPEMTNAVPGEIIWRGGDGKTALKSNENGSVAGKLPPGHYQITISAIEQTFNFDLPLHPAENVQILVTFFPDGKKPLLNSESSVTATVADAKSSIEEMPSQGNGTLAVQILSAETGKPIKGVQVFVSGLKQKLRSDDNGSIKVEASAGIYSVSLLHPTYNSQTKEIEITQDQNTELSFSLTPAGVELAEYIVLEPFLAGTLVSVIEEQKTSSEVTTILGAEQFSRSGDSDAASALARASGLTLVGGQFVFIRGLGERFSSTLINGAAVPSPDPTRRVVPMDLFPTNILESVLVQKSYSADRPGEFAGGTLEMRTRGIPEEFFFNFNAQTGVNTQSTFSDALTYKGGKTDFLGFDDGTRKLPDSVATASKDGPISQQTPLNPNGLSPVELEKLGEDISGVWDVTEKKRGPDTNFQTAIGDSFNLGDFRMGYIASGSWRREFRNQNEINREFASGSQTDSRLRNTQDFEVRRSWEEVQLTGYAATELEYKDKHRIFANTMFLRQTKDEARISQGLTDQESARQRRTKLWYFANQLQLNQIGGAHKLDRLMGLNIDWLYSHATAKREEPNTRDFRFDEDRQGNFFFSQRADSNQTAFGKLTDKDENWRVDISLPLELSPRHKVSLHGGVNMQKKNRSAAIQRFIFFPSGPDARNQNILSQSSLESILRPEFIGANGFQVRDSTRPTDSYRATQDLSSYYGKLDISLFDKMRITGGLRWEDNDQIVETFQSVANKNKPIISGIKRTDMLPSVSATFSISDKQQIRAGFSQTISRPDFRELSPAPFTDPNTNQETTGNPDLKQADITSYDVRWEYYPSSSETLLASFFWKNLTSPIEQVALPGAALQTFQNTRDARLFGFEIEFIKKLGFIHPYLENFFIGSNYTWSNSKVALTDENLQAQTSASRPLQGHSSQIFNIQIGYDNPGSGTQATLLYNTASERIVAVGLLGAPDKFEQPFNQLDFVLTQNINKWLTMRLTMGNLLNDKLVVTQGNEITREFKRGRQFGLGVRINF